MGHWSARSQHGGAVPHLGLAFATDRHRLPPQIRFVAADLFQCAAERRLLGCLPTEVASHRLPLQACVWTVEQQQSVATRARQQGPDGPRAGFPQRLCNAVSKKRANTTRWHAASVRPQATELASHPILLLERELVFLQSAREVSATCVENPAAQAGSSVVSLPDGAHCLLHCSRKAGEVRVVVQFEGILGVVFRPAASE